MKGEKCLIIFTQNLEITIIVAPQSFFVPWKKKYGKTGRKGWPEKIRHIPEQMVNFPFKLLHLKVQVAPGKR